MNKSAWRHQLKNKSHPVSSLTLFILAVFLVASFSGLTALAKTYRQALPGYQYAFPRDHAAHRAFKTEWWYYTGHLTRKEDGRRFGYELTFFRVGSGLDNLPKNTRWRLDDLYLAHFAISDEAEKRFHYEEKLNRQGIALAGALDKRYQVWNETWQAGLSKQSPNTMLVSAQSRERQNGHPKYAIKLRMTTKKPPIIHGKNGVSQKASCKGCASHYYSMTRLLTQGTLTVSGKPYTVSGVSWMDHEFGSNQLSEAQTGWDWFSIQLNNGTEVMLYLLRRKDGSIDPNSSGTLVDAQGRSRHLLLKEFTVRPTGQWKSPKTKATYPIGWQIQIPSANLSLKVSPAFPNQELVTASGEGTTYWEGSSHVTGRLNNKPVRGDAYVEMTGYASHFRSRI